MQAYQIVRAYEEPVDEITELTQVESFKPLSYYTDRQVKENAKMRFRDEQIQNELTPLTVLDQTSMLRSVPEGERYLLVFNVTTPQVEWLRERVNQRVYGIKYFDVTQTYTILGADRCLVYNRDKTSAAHRLKVFQILKREVPMFDSLYEMADYINEKT